MSARDMMPYFELYQPSDLTNALSLTKKFGADGWRLAGGQDSYDWFKDRAKRPKAVIDLNGVMELKGIQGADSGLEIGALETLTDISQNLAIREKYGLLAEAASKVASPQIRNVGTLGGNVNQDTRCWYYRAGLDCYRAGGNTCYADTPEGMNREHCLFGSDRCVAVTPSDTAPALVALDAEMVIVNDDGERVVKAEKYFIGPGVDITQMTVLRAEDILKAIRLPAAWAGSNYYFEKVADRNVWDFPLVNIATAIKLNGSIIEDIRIVCGGVECVPRRLTVVEDIVRGSEKNEATAELAGKSASRGATPLNYNHFKISLMENLVKRAIRYA